MSKYFYCLALCFFLQLLFSQQSTYVDEKGVFRWVENNEEIRLFGVNYTLPFAHGFRAINYIGKDHKQAIDKDVYHIARLGVDAYRVHIWDAEITDENGNLIPSPQLDLLDYMLAKFKERGIKTIVTPFKVGGNGYPEKDFPVPGFSAELQKWQTYANEDILQKQERYFTELLNHVNPYTGIAYKNEPDIIALEINNEPQHDDESVVTDYINRMVNVIRNTGYKNPIFYNVSERSEFVDAYLAADIQGCTFQWYPTGLVHNTELNINFLPHVDEYQIPFENKPAFQNKTRVIYEFDPADSNQPTLFPAMARSFRTAKFQFATQFAYDAIDLAYANTEYQTHYLNLAYTPSKAISLKIAAAAFREIENGQDFGNYPKNTNFLNTSLYPEEELAVYNSPTQFYYTSTTDQLPKKPKHLKEIAGVGNSELVQYKGKGAYFLDQVENSVWRLEIMPDVVWINDSFEKASLQKNVAVLKHASHKMQVSLSDLGDTYSITGIDKGNEVEVSTSNKTFQITPGTYLLHVKPLKSNFDRKQDFKNIQLNEFYTTYQTIDKIYVNHQSNSYIQQGEELVIQAKAIAEEAIESLEVVVPAGYQKTKAYPMEEVAPYEYQVKIPENQLRSTSFDYYLVAKTASHKVTFPGNITAHPGDWDFVSKDSYTTLRVEKNSKLCLYDAVAHDYRNFLFPSTYNAVAYNVNLRNSTIPSEKALHLSAKNLEAPIPQLSFAVQVEEAIKADKKSLQNTTALVISASSGEKSKQPIEVALQLSNGQVFGKVIELSSEVSEIRIPYTKLRPVKQVLLPRPYPIFQSFWFESSEKPNFNIQNIEAVQISIGPSLSTDEKMEKQELLIKRMVLE